MWQEFIDSGLLAQVSAYTIVGLDKPKKELEGTPVNFETLLMEARRSFKELKHWVTSHDSKLGEAVQLNEAFQIAELIDANAGPDEIITYIESDVSAALRQTPLFAQHASSFILELLGESLPPPSQCNLLRGICFGIECEVACLFGIQQCQAPHRILPLFQHLHHEHVISPESFKKWFNAKALGTHQRRVALDRVESFVTTL